MDVVRTLHLLFLGAWAGVILAEAVVELAGKDDEAQRAAARIHYWIDVLVEAPLLLAIVVTGAVLAWQAPVLTTMHWIKIAAGLIAVGANAYCVVVVVQRYRARSDAASLRRLGARIRIVSPAIGVPFGALAAYLGLAYFA